ncbi:MAG: efflux RND transporter periplasmic adaptor subunit [Roseiarcus sp.]|jgi:RND family efflux transporter MFP subunit|uniref:efflux RND transporter periplasmic adaptor subunit n=1 Tax=Roseiarcus sp. TaxID=1969460 RepID=UPI003C1924D6
MKRTTTWALTALAIAALAVAAAADLAHFHAPALPGAFLAIAIVCALLLILRALPLNARRPVVFLLALVLIVAVVGGLSYFQLVLKPTIVKNAISAAFAPKPTAVAVEEAKVEQWPPQLSAIGTLRAFQGIVVAPQVAGVVSAIHFQSGDDVPAGAPLVDLDTSVEEADLANGLAQLKNANVTLDRARALIANGNTPQSTVDAALAARDSAAASVEHTRAVIAEKTIKAPFAGRLGLRNVDLGQYVAAGVSLTTLQQLDPIYVDFSAPEGALANLVAGEETTLAVDSQPGRSFTGKVTAIDARVSADSRNVTVRAEFANPDHKLLPGMFADVTVTTGAPIDVLSLPRTAIVYSLYGNNAFVVVPAKSGDGLMVERRFIRVGATRGERIAILDGVKVGEKVVIAGQIKLQPNSPVMIDQGGALPPPAETPKP